MSIKYYISKVFWSILIAGTIFFTSIGDNQGRMLYFNIFTFISAILFPFSWYQIEKTALKYTDKNFGVTGIFKDGVPKTYLLTLFLLVNFIVSIPFGLICIFNEIKRPLQKIAAMKILINPKTNLNPDDFIGSLYNIITN